MSFTACQNVAGSGTDGQFISTELGTSNKRNNRCFATLIFPPGIPAGDWDVWWQEWLDLCSPRAQVACFCGLAIVLPNYPLLCSTPVRFLQLQKTIANLDDIHTLTYTNATTYRGVMFSHGDSFQYLFDWSENIYFLALQLHTTHHGDALQNVTGCKNSKIRPRDPKNSWLPQYVFTFSINSRA